MVGRCVLICFPGARIMSVAWSNGHVGSVVARHKWKGLLKALGAREDLVEKRHLESQEQSTRLPGHMPIQLDPGDDEVALDSEDDE